MLQSSRSEILCHWTGKDIDAKLHAGELTDEGARQAYVERFLATLATGLWMTSGQEIIGGYPFELTCTPTRVCFSEILLSRSSEHTQRYGRLAFGFARRFVADVGGSPVVYVRNSRSNPVLGVLAALSNRLSNITQEAIQAICNENKVKAVILENIKSEMIGGMKKATLLELRDAQNVLHRLSAFLKNMSEDETDDFEFLDEAEWRVVCYQDDLASQVQPGTVFAFGQRCGVDEYWESAPQIVRNPKSPPPFFLCFQPNELALVVFPDDQTRSLAWSNAVFQDWAKQRCSPLQLLTCQECVRF